ncbi:restriction endonuclease subunit S [Agrobacterium vitis]|uniref:restriction endonuclease subunit S n=1 Tax=Agrobacterium vitis TaxID=373 RepID=UPI00191F79BB|nr:restriction endonuclease subunit S [Agrobacterium vitis]QZO05125.1 restriction endonuclease subunit S [Agrobacterium vitis]
MKPKLRFPEFKDSDSWKEIPLQKLASPVADRATTLDAENVLSLSGEHGLVLQSDYFGKKIAGDNTDRYLKIRKDDFVYNDRTTKASSYGTIKRLSNYSDGIVSPIYKCFRFQPSENPTFWEWYFESGSHDPALRGLINEGARAGRFNISVTQFLSTNAWRPDNAEQQKIADCLDTVNALIEAQGRKVEVLKAHKKGLMQQLFPKEDETQPRLRFPEFEGSGEWEVKTLGAVGRVIRGASPRPKGDPRYYGGAVPRLMVQDVTRDGKWVTPSVDTLTEAGARLSRPCPAGTLTIVCSGAVGVVSFLAVDACIHDGFLALVDIDESIATKDFIFHVLSTLREQFERGATHGGVFTNLTTTSIDLFEFKCPSTPEQHRIADCLTSLDDLIAAETRKLDTLKIHKTGLMQQLFPKGGEDDA